MDLKERLSVALERSGGTKSGLAKACGVSLPSVIGWFNGRTKELSATNALKAALYLGVSFAWLADGRGSIDSSLAQEPNNNQGFAEVKEFRLMFHGGSGCSPTFEEIVEAKPSLMPVEFFIEHHCTPEKCRIFRVHGESMSPLLCDRDRIVVDTSKVEIVSGRIYAFAYGDQLRVKRLFLKLDNSLIVHSENPAVPEETISGDDLDQVFIIGRVISREGSSCL